jgi:hypothetical protein
VPRLGGCRWSVEKCSALAAWPGGDDDGGLRWVRVLSRGAVSTSVSGGRGKRVRFCRVTELITQLMEAREERELGRLKKQLSRLDLLVLDELGYVPASKLGAELLFDVISTAYERTSLIVTTNLPFENWVSRSSAPSGSPVPHSSASPTAATSSSATAPAIALPTPNENGDSDEQGRVDVAATGTVTAAAAKPAGDEARPHGNLPPDPPPWGNRLRRFPPTPSWGFFPSTKEVRHARDTAHQDPKPRPPSTETSPDHYPMSNLSGAPLFTRQALQYPTGVCTCIRRGGGAIPEPAIPIPGNPDEASK